MTGFTAGAVRSSPGLGEPLPQGQEERVPSESRYDEKTIETYLRANRRCESERRFRGR